MPGLAPTQWNRQGLLRRELPSQEGQEAAAGPEGEPETEEPGRVRQGAERKGVGG